MKDMNRKQLVEAGRKYDRINNEGGEGYNPYWSEIERREMEENQKRASQPKSKKEQIKAINEKIRKECGSVAREWGGEEVDKKQAAYYAEIKKLEEEINEEFLIEWTKKETQSRREEWNDFVKKEIAGGSMTPEKYRKMHSKTQTLGWGLDELKKAVQLHNLGPAK